MNVCLPGCPQLCTCPSISGTRLHVISNWVCKPRTYACPCRLVCTLGGLDQRLHLALLALPAVVPGCNPGASPAEGRLTGESSFGDSLLQTDAAAAADESLCLPVSHV